MLNQILRKVAYQTPPSMIRALGRVQFHFPVIRPLINRLGRGATSGKGVIRHGIAAGLIFDATGGNPGYLLGTSDPQEQAFYFEHLSPGDVAYDLGANMGFHSIIMAKQVGPQGRVYTFEPFPRNAEWCRCNAHDNGLQQIHVIEAAVSDLSGTVRLDTSRGEGVTHSICRKGERGINVRAVTIDELMACGTISPPNLMKIDIEGAEINALRGAMTTLRRYRPTILCEVHWLGRSFIEFVNQFMHPLGYRIRTLDNKPIPDEPVRYHAVLLPANTVPMSS